MRNKGSIMSLGITLSLLFLFLGMIILKENKDWRELYINHLVYEWKNTNVSQARLIDLDFNGVPELIVTYGYGNSFSDYTEVYRINEYNEMVKVHTKEADGIINNYKLYYDLTNERYRYIKESIYSSFVDIIGFDRYGKSIFYEINYSGTEYIEKPLFSIVEAIEKYDSSLELDSIIEDIESKYEKKYYFNIDDNGVMQFQVYSTYDKHNVYIEKEEFNTFKNQYFINVVQVKENNHILKGRATKVDIKKFVMNYKED
ncbi:hypothetical protein EDC18_10515 [Natranaerovirga pectinivora]|uniref:Uncharacterized protein n=1 Tax=Natranaerovirga pectinivora TaxID=682400 RepID=A0A4R3MNZ1_9FIRM|nr:hypothetical protein [Natranaerovirga pectinivora]TCT14534.1 hypothetical protein EDC18_10515 [Natranaerovirga pectinivora]